MIDVHVGDIMRREVETVAPESPLEAVVERLCERGVSCVVVCDRGKPVGIVRLKDAVGAQIEGRPGESPRAVAAVMRSPVRAIESTESVVRAATAVMLDSIRELPVIDASGSLVGLVGEGDLLRVYAQRYEQIKELSTIDPVTGLHTRRSITDVLTREWQRARRYDTQLAVMMADLDHFKRINDTYGHPAGDAVLNGVSKLLMRNLRATDAAGRYGGEEILVVLSQIGVQSGAIVAERWRKAAQRASFRAGDAREISVTVSIGVASIRSDYRSPEELVGAADSMLYRAKNSGRNRVEIQAG